MKRLNLTPLAKEWFKEQFALFIGEDSDKRDFFDFDVRDFCRFVILYVYDYQNERAWHHVAHNTALMLRYEQRSVNKILKKRTKNNGREQSSR